MWPSPLCVSSARSSSAAFARWTRYFGKPSRNRSSRSWSQRTGVIPTVAANGIPSRRSLLQPVDPVRPHAVPDDVGDVAVQDEEEARGVHASGDVRLAQDARGVL